jgi:hypothetical protein
MAVYVKRTRARDNIIDVRVKSEAHRGHHDSDIAGLAITPALKMVY